MNAVLPSGSISTADLVSTRGNCTSSSEKLAEVLEVKSPVSNERLKGYFCSGTVSNLSKPVLTETKVRVLERGLGLVPTPNMINEENLRRDFNELSRKMKCK